jgi:dipeptidase E
MKVLAISSSRVGNSGFLENAIPLIHGFTGKDAINIAFIPFASVQRDYDEYGNMVKEALASLPYSVNTVTPVNANSAIEKADVIMVGGGNTFKLLHDIYHYQLFQLIQNKVKNGTPYIGWSAGANIAGKSISTTNDMPIIQPQSFTSFGFLPFQINPHYINQTTEGFNGETRDQRLEEFVALNPNVSVVGLPEGTALRLEEAAVQFIGDKDGVLFQSDSNGFPKKRTIMKGEDLSPLSSVSRDS